MSLIQFSNSAARRIFLSFYCKEQSVHDLQIRFESFPKKMGTYNHWHSGQRKK